MQGLCIFIVKISGGQKLGQGGLIKLLLTEYVKKHGMRMNLAREFNSPSLPSSQLALWHTYNMIMHNMCSKAEDK